MHRCLIAGCGYVGAALGERLASQGHTVFGLRRRALRLPPGVEPLEADLAVPASLARLPGALDFVFYMASPGGADDALYRNAYVDGQRHLYEALARQGQRPRRVLFASSTAVYGQHDGEWIDESSRDRAGGFPRPAPARGGAAARARSLPGRRGALRRHLRPAAQPPDRRGARRPSRDPAGTPALHQSHPPGRLRGRPAAPDAARSARAGLPRRRLRAGRRGGGAALAGRRARRRRAAPRGRRARSRRASGAAPASAAATIGCSRAATASGIRPSARATRDSLRAGPVDSLASEPTACPDLPNARPPWPGCPARSSRRWRPGSRTYAPSCARCTSATPGSSPSPARGWRTCARRSIRICTATARPRACRR